MRGLRGVLYIALVVGTAFALTACDGVTTIERQTQVIEVPVPVPGETQVIERLEAHVARHRSAV